MKNNTADGHQLATAATAIVGTIILLAGAGCNCNTIYIVPQGAPQSLRPTTMSLPPPSGGNFSPATALVAGPTGTTTLCTQQVTKKKAVFYPPYQGPSPGENLFRGWLVNTNTGQILSNNTYVLQWILYAGGGANGCATPVAGTTTDVSFSAANPNQYGMIAHFKSGYVPPSNQGIQLNGVWTTQ